ncbi:hypothetical protein [Amycolatopsis keratiniphila]|uniref:Uncharacterized protein n=1 Tax=Amycolatopsis keratiniphila subsp. keratiniphila TaxID=227715 RepID=A0A1W2M205_9PSEU|nr:hypothetical protein [Amycolatopsis keratiniphila]ONF73938.1 hypothetical protein AVR91_0204195 [Amycolatopsis keratiniphila subsp. keratiniphila]
MTTTGVREALAVLPTWRWSAAYVAAAVAVLLLNLVARVSGALVGAVAGYLIAGPLGGAAGLLVGASAQDGPVFRLVSSLILDGSARLGGAMNRAAAEVADLAQAAKETAETSAYGRPLAGVRV